MAPKRQRKAHRGRDPLEKFLGLLLKQTPRKRLWIVGLVVFGIAAVQLLVELAVALGIGYAGNWPWVLLWVAVVFALLGFAYYKLLHGRKKVPGWFLRALLVPIFLSAGASVAYAFAGAQLRSVDYYLSPKTSSILSVDCSKPNPYVYNAKTLQWVSLGYGWGVRSSDYSARVELGRHFCVAPVYYKGNSTGCTMRTNLFAVCTVTGVKDDTDACVNHATRQCWPGETTVYRVVRNATKFYSPMPPDEYNGYLMALALQDHVDSNSLLVLPYTHPQAYRMAWFQDRHAALVKAVILLPVSCLGALLVYLGVLCLVVTVDSLLPPAEVPPAPPANEPDVDVHDVEVELEVDDGAGSPVPNELPPEEQPNPLVALPRVQAEPVIAMPATTATA